MKTYPSLNFTYAVDGLLYFVITTSPSFPLGDLFSPFPNELPYLHTEGNPTSVRDESRTRPSTVPHGTSVPRLRSALGTLGRDPSLASLRLYPTTKKGQKDH